MGNINIEHKTKLGESLAKGHSRFGKVAARKSYHSDDEGGSGIGELSPFEAHPLLANQPDGASSDLTRIVINNKYSVDEADKRSHEAIPELQKKLDNVNAHKRTHARIATPSPFGG